MPGRYPFSAYAAPVRRTPGFSQGYCSVAPATAAGHLMKGAGYWPCRVEITGGCVTLAMQARNRMIEAAPVASVQLAAPSWIRQMGTGTVIMMNGRPWVVDFARAGQSRGGLSALFRGVRRARILNREFVSALLAAGAGAPGTGQQLALARRRLSA
jgi:hypothetical protein